MLLRCFFPGRDLDKEIRNPPSIHKAATRSKALASVQGFYRPSSTGSGRATLVYTNHDDDVPRLLLHLQTAVDLLLPEDKADLIPLLTQPQSAWAQTTPAWLLPFSGNRAVRELCNVEGGGAQCTQALLGLLGHDRVLVMRTCACLAANMAAKDHSFVGSNCKGVLIREGLLKGHTVHVSFCYLEAAASKGLLPGLVLEIQNEVSHGSDSFPRPIPPCAEIKTELSFCTTASSARLSTPGACTAPSTSHPELSTVLEDVGDPQPGDASASRTVYGMERSLAHMGNCNLPLVVIMMATAGDRVLYQNQMAVNVWGDASSLAVTKGPTLHHPFLLDLFRGAPALLDEMLHHVAVGSEWKAKLKVGHGWDMDSVSEVRTPPATVTHLQTDMVTSTVFGMESNSPLVPMPSAVGKLKDGIAALADSIKRSTSVPVPPVVPPPVQSLLQPHPSPLHSSPLPPSPFQSPFHSPRLSPAPSVWSSQLSTRSVSQSPRLSPQSSQSPLQSPRLTAPLTLRSRLSCSAPRVASLLRLSHDHALRSCPAIDTCIYGPDLCTIGLASLEEACMTRMIRSVEHYEGSVEPCRGSGEPFGRPMEPCSRSGEPCDSLESRTCEVQAVPVIDPKTKQEVFLLLLNDITESTAMENVLTEVTKAQLKMLETMYPRHVLENILMGGTAAMPHLMASQHEGVTILFMDIVGFTAMSKAVEAKQVMEYLNTLFTMLDDLVQQFQIYKVETAGDCYIVAGGLMVQDSDNFISLDEAPDREDGALRVLKFAQAALHHSRTVCYPHNGKPTVVRVGMHTGSCMSGLIGNTQMKYSLFGDSMNTASRMESTALPGCTQISEATFNLLPDTMKEHFTATGGVEVKGRGLMQTFFWEATPKEPAPMVKADDISSATLQKMPLLYELLSKEPVAAKLREKINGSSSFRRRPGPSAFSLPIDSVCQANQAS